jgi:ribosomal protein L17
MKNKQSIEDIETWQKAWELHEAAGKILQALKPLTINERRRTMNYLWDKYVTHPDPEEK